MLSVTDFDNLYEICSQVFLLSPTESAFLINQVDSLPYEAAKQWLIWKAREKTVNAKSYSAQS